MKFKIGDFILIKEDFYKIKFISDKLKEDYCISLNEVRKNKDIIYKWFPVKNEKCLFIDIGGNEFVDNFIRVEEGFINDYSYISKNSYEVDNYCPCCYEKEPKIQIDRFDYCEPFLGQEGSLLKKERIEC